MPAARLPHEKAASTVQLRLSCAALSLSSTTFQHHRDPITGCPSNEKCWQGEILFFFFLKTAKYVLCLFLCSSRNTFILIPHLCSVQKREDMLGGFPPSLPRPFAPSCLLTLRKPRTVHSASLPGDDACLSLDRISWLCAH